MSQYEIRRSTTVDAPAARILPLIARFPEWRRWSPFERDDADLRRDYRGADEGVGAVYEYAGRRAGAGILTITGTTPEQVRIHLEFLRPVKSVSEHVFDLSESDGATTVTWTMTGRQNPVLRLLMPMAKVLGPMFDQGLGSLKAVAEA